MTGWRPGVIVARFEDGQKYLPGWISEPFGLDWGIHAESGEAMWVIHHLPSGWALCGMVDEIGVVMKLVDLLRTLGGWDFTDPTDLGPYSDAMLVARASGFEVYSPARVCRPHYPDQVEEPA